MTTYLALSKAQTMMGNRLVYGNYLEGYDLIDENDQPIKFGYRVNHIKRPAQPTVASTAHLRPTPATSSPRLLRFHLPANTTVVVTFEEFNLTEGDSFTLQITMGRRAPLRVASSCLSTQMFRTSAYA